MHEEMEIRFAGREEFRRRVTDRKEFQNKAVAGKPETTRHNAGEQSRTGRDGLSGVSLFDTADDSYI